MAKCPLSVMSCVEFHRGSILGPLLFLIYVNDMKSAINCKLLLYADDSTLVVSGYNLSEFEASLNKELLSVSKWLVDNKLSLHLGKTESIMFGSPHCLNKYSQPRIICKNSVVKSTTNVKHLGDDTDQTLGGEIMANNVIKNITARTKFLYRESKYLDVQTARMLASSIVQCHFDYACFAWYTGLPKMSKNKLQICQSKLIRLVLKLDNRCHITSDHFKSLN